jgi:hypothetical protein
MDRVSYEVRIPFLNMPVQAKLYLKVMLLDGVSKPNVQHFPG